MHFGPASPDPAVSGLPRGEVLGTYDSYAEARKVVDRLAEQDFDVRTVSIVGVDLRTVERIRNRLTYATVALRSALQGAFFGLMLGILMSLIDPSGAGVQILYTVGLGIGIWMLFGVIGHAIRKGKGFDSVQQLVPTRFDVVCEFSAAGRARQILGTGTPAPAAAPAAPTRSDAPTTGSPAGPASTQQRPGGEDGVEDGREDSAGPSAPPAPAAPPAAATPPADGTGPASAPSPAAAPGHPDGGQDTAATSRRRTHLFPDLPDGRPQYGIRLPEAEAQALRERVLGDQARQPAGAVPSDFAAPDYAARGRGRRRDPQRPVDGGQAGSGEQPEREAGKGRFARPGYGRHAAGTEDGGRAEAQDGPGAGREPEAGPGAGDPGGDARD